MPLFDSLSKIAKTVGDQASIATKKANEAIEVAKVNSLINTEEEKIEKLKAEIGNIVFQKFENSEEVYPEVIDVCNNIISIKEEIAALNQKIIKIKNIKICASCSAEIALDAPFCQKCGAKQEVLVVEDATFEEVVTETCPGCGAEITEETIFCSSCGAKVKE
jgi:ribosomal protein L40E